MPRISAPTLAEHRQLRRNSLLAAGRMLVLRDGANSLTMGALAAEAGLSRPTVYEYFDSVPDLLATLVEEQWQAWDAEVADAVSGPGRPADRLGRYVRAALTFVAGGGHRLGRILADAELPPECATRVATLHAEAARPLAGLLLEFGVSDPAATAELVRAVIEAAARRIEGGAEPEAEIERVDALLSHGLEST